MIAFAGLEKFKQNQFNDLDFPAKPRWQLDENANFLKRCWCKKLFNEYWLLKSEPNVWSIDQSKKKLD